MIILRPSILHRSNKKVSVKLYLSIAFVLAILGQFLLEDKGIAKYLTAYLFVVFVSALYTLRPSWLWGRLEETELEQVGPTSTRGLLKRNVSDEGLVVVAEDLEDTRSRSLETAKVELKPVRKRLHYLDNIKVFLTFLVVLHHTADAFGCCGDLSWMLVIGNYDNAFKSSIRRFMIFNQSYFMCLFFLISGYLTASSYKRKGVEAFIRGRTTRLLVPAWASFFIVNPFSFFLAQWTAKSDLVYFPCPGATWFIYWLLFFEWIYVLFMKEKMELSAITSTIPFPSTRKRWLWGLCVCGLAQYVVSVGLSVRYFYAMPIASPGTLFSDILLFSAGTIAGESGWLSPERTITEQIDIAPWKLRLMVCLEGTVVMYLHHHREDPLERLVFFLAAGMLCVDASVAYLQFFQEHVNQDWSYLADGAYTVYLIHPFVTQACTSMFLKVYDMLYPGAIQFDPVVFDIFVPSASHLYGPGDGSVHLWIGFLVVLAVNNAILWPLSYWLCKLPILNKYL